MPYASVASLIRTIQSDVISNSPAQVNLICGHREKIVTLHEKVSSLGVFLNNFEKNNVSGEMTDFEVEVKEVVNAVEHTFQLRLTDIETAKNISQNKRARQKFSHSLQQVAEDIDRVWKELTKIQEKGKQASKESLVQDFSNHPDHRDGGIGKTTLAKEIYNDVFIRCHFDVRAWDTVSQQHNVKEILSLLRSTKGDTDNTFDGRLLLTTRNNEEACYTGTENFSLQMDFMDQDESWKVFKSAAFANEELPYEFETIEKQIAEKCHGLPLTIAVVAGLLKSKRAIEDWESVAQDVKSFITNDPKERCSHVLGLSCNNLTSNLKACLLYFGIFWEDTEIQVKYLMRLRMAEGFLNSENDLDHVTDV
ncbi:hypothetical protein CQW23_07028 [Capsicum baccatum]|uniref:NB-ARC domain-containing protein n=1 Tax=Capsicum baccatum TaxID=33114 RepID=A0A2G2X504_CAPBA|nr:hypothetical protein CQW23_07028 [Capsicum baccatum]